MICLWFSLQLLDMNFFRILLVIKITRKKQVARIKDLKRCIYLMLQVTNNLKLNITMNILQKSRRIIKMSFDFSVRQLNALMICGNIQTKFRIKRFGKVDVG
jgi:hypothetical protein